MQTKEQKKTIALKAISLAFQRGKIDYAMRRFLEGGVMSNLSSWVSPDRKKK